MVKVREKYFYVEGRSLGRVYHIFDNDGREISLWERDALELAQEIIKTGKVWAKVEKIEATMTRRA